MISDWIYKNKNIKTIDDMKIDEPKVFGFVYLLRLINKKTGKLAYHYIGKKNVFSITSKTATKTEMNSKNKSDFKRKKMRNGLWKYYTTVVKESNWKDYISSNMFIKRNHDRYNIEREILIYSTNDNDLTYQEAKQIICMGALEDEFYLNDAVSLRRFGSKIIN